MSQPMQMVDQEQIHRCYHSLQDRSQKSRIKSQVLLIDCQRSGREEYLCGSDSVSPSVLVIPSRRQDRQTRSKQQQSVRRSRSSKKRIRLWMSSTSGCPRRIHFPWLQLARKTGLRTAYSQLPRHMLQAQVADHCQHYRRLLLPSLL